MRHFYFRIIYIITILSFISLPLLQMKYDIFKKQFLYGVSLEAAYPKFTLNGIKSGEYQKKFELWFNQNFGLKDYLIKTNNQIYYSLFNQTPPSSQVVVGKHKQLFEGTYISEYFNFIPPVRSEILEQKVIELKKLQDLLSEKGKAFLLLITPSKAAVYPEYIPEWIKPSQSVGMRNYDIIIPLLDKYGINYVDGHQITDMHKKTDKYDMFPPGGTHWNYLAAYFTSKVAIEKLEKITGKDYVDIISDRIEESPPLGTDRDLANLINLWKAPIDYLSPHPIISQDKIGNQIKPSFFMEGASFSEQFINTLHNANAFKQFDLYFYYHTHIQFKEGIQDGSVLGEIDKVDWDDVFNHDIIMLEMNEQNIPKLQNGFLQDALAQLDPLKLNFSNINKEYVEKTVVNGVSGFVFKKGASSSGTLFVESEKIMLEKNKEYTISYKTSGYKYLNVDLFPDDLPQFNNDKITDTVGTFNFDFKSDSDNMNAATVRFFIDGMPGVTDKDTIIYDIKLTTKTK